MKISVYLHTILGRPTPGGIQRQIEVELPQGSTLLDLLHLLEIELTPDQVMLAVNGVMVDENYVLSDGDRVNLMPAISGGSANSYTEDTEKRKTRKKQDKRI